MWVTMKLLISYAAMVLLAKRPGEVTIKVDDVTEVDEEV